jgi:type VI protein secretion system component VasF
MVVDSWLYLFYYGVMKYRHGERVYVRVWICFALMVISGVIAMYFYQIAVTNKFLTPQESELLNKPCVLFGYFDYHDL